MQVSKYKLLFCVFNPSGMTEDGQTGRTDYIRFIKREISS